MFERCTSKASRPPVPILRYVGLLRRAAYDAEKPQQRRSWGIGLPIGRLARALVGARLAMLLVRVLGSLRIGWRSRARRVWSAALYPAFRSALSWLLPRRRLARRLSRLVIPDTPQSDYGLMRVSYALMRRDVPLISRVTRQLVNAALVSALSAQMSAGHLQNTLLIARLINLSFRPAIRARRYPVAFLYFQALFRCRQYQRILSEVDPEETFNQHYLNHILGIACLYSGQSERARKYLEHGLTLNDRYFLDHRMLGRAHLMLGDERAAAACFEASVKLAPETVMAHQNYAGRYDIEHYKPKAWELRHAGRLMLYDNYGQLAEDLFLIGRFGESFVLYQKMLGYQGTLGGNLPAELNELLAAYNPRFDAKKRTRLLSYEWVTQFGHIGLLDSYAKMSRLGFYPAANHVLLAPADKVANHDFLSYWDDHFIIVRDDRLIDELFPYQRMIGDNFMAYPGIGGVAEPWTRVAARAQKTWSDRRRAPLLRLNASHRALGLKTLAALGVPDGAWYVGLHVREGGYHAESSGDMSAHRNARINDYLEAVEAVTSRGGYVIRLGDSSMRPLPNMPRVIDYARSPHKSSQADIFFCATSRFVIGTTSGLTTACLCFGTPMVLVNCISNDWQFWTSNTDFIVKRVWDRRNKRHLTLAETFSQPIQPTLINAQVMRRYGLEAEPSSPEDIAAAVIYKLDLMDGLRAAPDDASELMKAYRKAIAHNPFMFGAARPVTPFLERHSDMLVPIPAPDFEKREDAVPENA